MTITQHPTLSFCPIVRDLCRRPWWGLLGGILLLLLGSLSLPDQVQAQSASVSTGGYHTCALGVDGTVTCWGKNTDGQTTVPTNLGPAKAVSAGRYHTCALGADGAVTCWGWNINGQTTVPDGLVATAISTRYYHTCALGADGTVTCWGLNDSGQTTVPDGLVATAVSAGGDHTCALGTTGTVTCWGGNFSGQRTVPDGLVATAVSAGLTHTCALGADGTVTCWGRNTYGQTTVPDGLVAMAVSVGRTHTCALGVDGTVTCWGSNTYDQRDVPYGLELATAVSAGEYHTCALGTDGTVTCWGYNNDGQTTVPSELVVTLDTIAVTPMDPIIDAGATQAMNATGTFSDGMEADLTPGLPILTTRASEGRDHTCALRADGTVTCWGSNSDGQTMVPTGLGPATAVSAGGAHTCARGADGTVTCWGSDSDGQKNDVPFGLVARAISAGDAHTCALGADGTISCWGNDTFEQTTGPDGFVASVVSAGGGHTCALGADGTISCWGNDTFGQTTGPAGFVASAVSAGGAHTCAREADGTVTCWGSNSDGQSDDAPAGLVATAVSAGGAHTCALEADGTVTCWGWNNDGQSVLPDQLGPFTAVSAGYEHTCALRGDGTVTCRGNNAYGQTEEAVDRPTWGSTDLAVGTIDANGLATGVAGGTTDLWADLFDVSGLTTLTVVAGEDTVPPVVTAPSSITVEAVDSDGTPATNSIIDTFLGAATATDEVDGPLPTTNDAPANFRLGITTVTFSATDAAGNTGSDTSTVTVADTTLPVITLLGASSVTVEVGSLYDASVDAGATAADTVDGDLTGSLVTGGLPVDTSATGTFQVTYDVSDQAGNPATQVTRTVHVVDTTLPVITLLGASSVTVEVGSPYTDAGATAADTVDGDLTGSLVTGGLPVDTSATGTFQVTYDVSDQAGNPATQVTRTVHVVDTTLPVITLLGASSVTVEVGSPYTDAGATAADTVDGDLTGSLVTGGLPVDTSATGTFQVTYDVSDQAGNPATQVTRTVHVVDTTPPVITLVGTSPVTVEVGSPYTDAGATAADTVDGDLTGSLVTGGLPVDTSATGTFQVTYDVSDQAGNPATQVTRMVTVMNTPPVVTSLSLNSASINENDSVTLVGHFADPTSIDSHTVSITWGEGLPITVVNLPPGLRTFQVVHQYLDDVPTHTPLDSSLIQVAVTDSQGGVGGNSTNIVVNNVAPVIPVDGISGPVGPIALGVAALVTATFNDVGSLDTHTCTFSWGDGTADDVVALVGTGNTSCAASHPYAGPGIYQVTTTVEDDDTGTVSRPFDFVVVYDPDGGFVTGGGFIDSPRGAYQPDPTLTGKANFSFVSKYKKGAKIPTGNTQFHFKAASVNFHSSNYEWLVVAGAKAQFKGSGKVNGHFGSDGVSGYGFLLTATDGQRAGGGGVDKFRIKVVDKATDTVVYDNNTSGSDDIDAANPQEISGGSIVIHTKKHTKKQTKR